MKERYMKTLLTALAVLLAALMIVYFTADAKAKDNRTALNAVYQGAFYETCELLSGMQVNLKKLMVTGSGSMETELLNEISAQAQGAQSNLTMLPIGENAVNATVKFVNQTGDFAKSLSKKISKGGAVSEEDRETISVLLETVTKLALDMDRLLSDYNEGKTDFDEFDFSFDGDGELAPLTNPASAYPVLLYDGPFSDGSDQESMKGLSGRTYSASEAKDALMKFTGFQVDAELIGETNDRDQAYEFELERNGERFYASVSKTGGKPLYMISEASAHEEKLSESECILAAKQFLLNHGFGEMQESYFRKYDGMLTVNLAPVSDGIVMYPDLVKIQVSMKDGSIMGFEMRNYFKNHHERVIPDAALSQGEAKERINPSLRVYGVKLCVIPVGFHERLSYEFSCTSAEDHYLIYIDAENGEELQIYQVVSTTDGTLVQ